MHGAEWTGKLVLEGLITACRPVPANTPMMFVSDGESYYRSDFLGTIREIDLLPVTLDVFGLNSRSRDRIITYATARAHGEDVSVEYYCQAIGWSDKSLYHGVGLVASYLNARHRSKMAVGS